MKMVKGRSSLYGRDQGQTDGQSLSHENRLPEGRWSFRFRRWVFFLHLHLCVVHIVDSTSVWLREHQRLGAQKGRQQLKGYRGLSGNREAETKDKLASRVGICV